jgi:hypothetical protein
LAAPPPPRPAGAPPAGTRARPPDARVTGDMVDALNAEHALAAAAVTKDGAIEHLRRSGTVFRDLVAGCSAAGRQSGGGRVERFAQIAVRHPDDHRAELQAALGG